MSSSDPLFRFYFDGEETPRFSLHLSEFGEKEPFIKPLAEVILARLITEEAHTCCTEFCSNAV